jgi:endonuclease III
MVEEIIKRLEKVFPDKLELNFSTPFELVVAVVLSAQERDAKVNEVTKELFKKFNTPQQFANASLEEIEKEISSISFYKKKAKYIKEISQILVEKYGGEVPKSIEELEKLPGIGRKSANMILYNAFGINEGIAVDSACFEGKPKARFNQTAKTRKGRAGAYETGAKGSVGQVLKPTHSARKIHMHRPKAQALRMPSLRPLPL